MENDRIQYHNTMAKTQNEIDRLRDIIRIKSERESACVSEIEKMKEKVLRMTSENNSQHTGKRND